MSRIRSLGRSSRAFRARQASMSLSRDFTRGGGVSAMSRPQCGGAASSALEKQ
jgi:hypothetical protein